MMRFKMNSTYMAEKDLFAHYYVVIPCLLLAFVHLSTNQNFIKQYLGPFVFYLEAVSVLPQLYLMQCLKIVEPFTAHCAHWILQVLDTQGRLLAVLGYGLLPPMVLLSEFVPTFILADFCYHNIKSLFGRQLALRLPSGVV